MRAHFIHRKHLCLVFECLSSNLYELIKQNGFRGLSIQLVKVFTTQLLDTMEVLHEARLIHCDLKPENILLKRCVRDLPFPPLSESRADALSTHDRSQPPIATDQGDRLRLGLP